MNSGTSRLVQRRLIWSLFTLLVLPGLAGCDRGAGNDGVQRKDTQDHLVETAPVVIDNLSVVRTRTGTLRARREVRVFTQEEGRITQLPFYEGDAIKQGDVLVRLDDTLIRAQLGRASATRKQAEHDAERLKKLIARKVVTEDEYTRALTAVDVARADEQVLKARLGYMTIRSPLDGVVRERFSDAGNIAERHQHLLTIYDPSSLLTELPVSELVMPYISGGDIARVHIDALGDQVHAGQITRIFPGLDPLTRRGTIEVELQPVPAGAAPGQLCRVELNTHAARRKVIPFSALRRDDMGEYVFILDTAGKAQRVDVQSGLRLAEKIEILEGLEAGDQVITKGFLGLVTGKEVKPVNSAMP
ncbi:MAG: efflux RND transporter periplasmic adaptor subunit [Gammaproteobacteria bacterium]